MPTEIKLSQTLEERLITLIREKQAEQWLKENKVAVEAYNHRIEQDGVFSDGIRVF